MPHVVIRYIAKEPPWLKLEVSDEPSTHYILIDGDIQSYLTREGEVFLAGNPAAFARIAGLIATCLVSSDAEDMQVILTPGVDLTADSPELIIILDPNLKTPPAISFNDEDISKTVLPMSEAPNLQNL